MRKLNFCLAWIFALALCPLLLLTSCAAPIGSRRIAATETSPVAASPTTVSAEISSPRIVVAEGGFSFRPPSDARPEIEPSYAVVASADKRMTIVLLGMASLQETGPLAGMVSFFLYRLLGEHTGLGWGSSEILSQPYPLKLAGYDGLGTAFSQSGLQRNSVAREIFTQDVLTGRFALIAPSKHQYFAVLAFVNHGPTVWVNDRFVAAHTEEGLRTLFAPIDSADEALGYAVAVTGLEARFGLSPETLLTASFSMESFRGFSVREIEDTYVETVPDGYLVHLFLETRLCHGASLSAFAVHVSREGTIEVVEKLELYSWSSLLVC
jgi:hypothetical protein